MTLVKFNQRPAERRANAFFEDFFNHFPSRLVNDDFASGQGSVPVNIKETEQSYVLEVVAPGMEKADFKVNLIQLPGQHYFKTLRQKLNWGLDIRN